MAMSKATEEFDSYIRFGKPMPHPRREFEELDAAREYVYSGIETAKLLLARRRDRDECGEECAALANKAMGLMEQMRSHTAGWRLIHAAQGGAVKAAMLAVSHSLNEVKHRAWRMQAEVDVRTAAIDMRRGVRHLLPLFGILLLLPIWTGLVAPPEKTYLRTFCKAIPYLFGVVWAWMEDTVKKELLKLADERLTAAWIERAAACVKAAVEDTIFPFIPNDSPASSP